MTLEAGQEAPDFTLVDEANSPVTLSSLRGTPVVLMFYPFDFSGTCTTEHCDIRDNYGSWMTKGARVFGISRDSRFAHAAFKQAEQLPYSLLADLKGEVASKYGVWNADAGRAERATFVVDRGGKVAFVTTSEVGQQRDHSQIEAAIQ